MPSAGACLAMFSVLRPQRESQLGLFQKMAPTWNARMLGPGYYHHVVPRSFFPSWWQRCLAAHRCWPSPRLEVFVVGVVLSGTAFVWCTLMVLIVVKCLVQPITVPITCFRWVYERHWNGFDIQIHYPRSIMRVTDPMTRRWEILHAMVVAAFKRHILSQCASGLMAW
jgi:hypothetical protein